MCQEVLPDFRGLKKTKQILSAQSKLRIKDKLQQLFGKKLADDKNSKKEKIEPKQEYLVWPMRDALRALPFRSSCK